MSKAVIVTVNCGYIDVVYLPEGLDYLLLDFDDVCSDWKAKLRFLKQCDAPDDIKQALIKEINEFTALYQESEDE
jgi:hypothetical protein